MKSISGSGCLLLILTTVALDIIGAILGGWVLTKLWVWFIVPVFGLPVLSIVYAVGLAIVIQFLTRHQDVTHKKETHNDLSDVIGAAIAKSIFYPLFALLIGWIVYQFV